MNIGSLTEAHPVHPQSSCQAWWRDKAREQDGSSGRRERPVSTYISDIRRYITFEAIFEGFLPDYMMPILEMVIQHKLWPFSGWHPVFTGKVTVPPLSPSHRPKIWVHTSPFTKTRHPPLKKAPIRALFFAGARRGKIGTMVRLFSA
jgi:hypothetical protein